MANNHNSAHPGKRVRVKFKDGTVKIARFLKNDGKETVLADDQGDEFRVRRDHITSLSIYKPKG